MNQQFETPADALAHYGVLGMKWGVRKDESKARAGREGGTLTRRQKRIARLERVGSGNASVIDKLMVYNGEVSPVSVIRRGGFSAAAMNKAQNMKARDARMAKGEAHALDLINRIGGDRLVDFGGVDSQRKTTPASQKLKAEPSYRATTKKIIKDHNELTNQEFFRKHAVTKNTYARRIRRNGDPLANPKTLERAKREQEILSGQRKPDGFWEKRGF